jgi:spermidine synthase
VRAEPGPSTVEGTSVARGETRLPVLPQVAVLLCFFFSGLGSLVLEVVWTRLLRVVFGSTTLSVATILVAYMLGLGLGGLWGGRFARRIGPGRALRLYGGFELAIALYALCVPALLALFPALGRLFLYRLDFWPAALVRFALSVLALALPTFLMGATLPLVVSALRTRDESAGGRIAGLYALNTFGAVSGVLLATFVLFGALGVRGTNVLGAGVDALAGAVALFVLAPRFARAGSAPAAEPRAPGRPAGRAALPAGMRAAVAAYALVGFTALVNEVAWTRTLSMVMGSSIYAFAAMLAAFLLGIALGAMAVRTFVDRLRRPLVAYAWGIGLLGVLSLGTMLLLPRLPDLFLALVGVLGLDRGGLMATQLSLSVLAMLPPTLVLGALFPLLARALAGGGVSAPDAVGRVYFANTVGSASGAFAAGFVLIPGLGLQGTLIGAVALNLASAAALLAGQRELARTARLALVAAAGAGIATLAALPPRWNRSGLANGAFTRLLESEEQRRLRANLPAQFDSEEIVFYEEGLNTTVSVHRWFANVSLNVNGKPDASSIADMPTQVLSGQIPMLFGTPASDVLVIGWASGVTVGSVARHPVRRIDVVELEPVIIDASRFFDAQSGRPLEDPRVRVVIDDGRTFLTYAPERYDVIISEPSNPWITGAASLFTREHLEAARGALKPGGRYLQWVQLYGMDALGLRAILNTLRAVFPYVYGFATQYGDSDLMLMAAFEPLEAASLPRWERLDPAVRDDLVRVGNFTTEDLWSLVRLLPEDVAAFAGPEGPLNTDDNMLIELRTPWLLYADTLTSNWEPLAASVRGIAPLLATLPAAEDWSGRVALSYAMTRREYGIAQALATRPGSAWSPHSLAARVELGRGTREMELPDQLETLDRALERAPGSPLLHVYRAQVRLDADDLAGALVDAEAALAQSPDDPRAHALAGLVLRRTGRHAEAAAALERALQGPFGDLLTSNGLRVDLAMAYAAIGRVEEPLSLLEEYLQRDPFSAPHWRLLAAAQERAGRPDDARRSARNAEDLERAAPAMGLAPG